MVIYAADFREVNKKFPALFTCTGTCTRMFCYVLSTLLRICLYFDTLMVFGAYTCTCKVLICTRYMRVLFFARGFVLAGKPLFQATCELLHFQMYTQRFRRNSQVTTSTHYAPTFVHWGLCSIVEIERSFFRKHDIFIIHLSPFHDVLIVACEFQLYQELAPPRLSEVSCERGVILHGSSSYLTGTRSK